MSINFTNAIYARYGQVKRAKHKNCAQKLVKKIDLIHERDTSGSIIPPHPRLSQ